MFYMNSLTNSQFCEISSSISILQMRKLTYRQIKYLS